MVGAGAVTFAVMGYVIAKQVPDRVVGSQVELNPKLLAFILGEPEEKVAHAIGVLCSPDAKTRTQGEEGRRLVKIGEYSYRVVNGAKYRAIRDEESRRTQNREAKRRQRTKPKSTPLRREGDFVKAVENGDEEQAEKILLKALADRVPEYDVRPDIINDKPVLLPDSEGAQ